MKEFYIDSDGIRLHAKLELPEYEGKCPLTIVIHGLTGHMEEEHIKAVAETFRECGIGTLRVEMYGHGKSEGDFGQHTLFKWINNALDVVDYAKSLDFVSDLYIAGHSQGGLLTMIIAGLRNNDFKAVIPLSPATSILGAAKEGNFFGLPFDPKHIPDHFNFMGIDFSGNYFRVAQMIHLEELIDKYEGKVLLIHGDEDEAVPLSCSIEAAKRYRDAKLVVIKGDDHCYTRHLDEVVEALRDFLKTV